MAPASRTPLGRSIVGASIWAASMVSLAIGLLTAPPGGTIGIDLALTAATVLAVLSPVTVGVVLVTRVPRSVIGWLLLVSGLLIALSVGLGGVADYGLNSHPGSVPGAIWIGVLSQLTWVPFVVGLGFYLPLLYPSGRLPSPRWRPLGFLGILAIVCSTAQNALGPFAPGTFPAVDQNPLAIGGVVGQLAALLGAASNAIGVVAVPLIAASLVIRYRRASGIERQQLKWLAAVAGVIGPALAVAILAGGSDASGLAGAIGGVAWLIVLLGFALLPVAIGIAILRYRLYEIDRLISRTIGWAVVTLILGLVFVAVILVLQALIAPVTRSNALAVAGSTLVVAVLFQPLRRRVQRLVDRRFNRDRYDAERTVVAFTARLRDEVDLVATSTAILATVDAALQPSTSSLWLRG